MVFFFSNRVKCIRNFVFACLPLALGIGIMSFVAIVVDSIFFEKLLLFNKINGAPILFLELFNPKTWAHLGVKGSFTVTMLNNLVYNMDSANLAQHGLHPRFFHLFLNYPILFGNLAYLATKTMIQKARLGEWTSQSKLVTGEFAPSVFFWRVSLMNVDLLTTDNTMLYSFNICWDQWHRVTVDHASPGSQILNAVDSALGHYSL